VSNEITGRCAVCAEPCGPNRLVCPRDRCGEILRAAEEDCRAALRAETRRILGAPPVPAGTPPFVALVSAEWDDPDDPRACAGAPRPGEK
jgi:predicted nucleic acid-binding Zn ribbon protein